MLMQALYGFATRIKMPWGDSILNSPEFDSREIAWLIDIKQDGTFIGFVPLIENGSGTIFHKLPRTLEPKDSGEVADFLVEDIATILKLDETENKVLSNKGLEKHQNFWGRIQNASDDIKHPSLMAMLKWKTKYLDTRTIDNPAFESYTPPKGKATEQWVATTSSGQKVPLYFRPKASIDATFCIDGNVVILDTPILEWWKRWFAKWLAGKENACRAARGGGRVCAVTGIPDMAISNSHLPKIKRVPQALGVGASIASAEADSFHSYGLSIQKAKIQGSKSAPDASYTNVSVRAAIAYCDALNYLLTDDDHHYKVDPVVFCFWCRDSAEGHKVVNLILNKAYPEKVKDLFKSTYAGTAPQNPIHADRLYTLALSGNAGRIMIQQWTDQSLSEITGNLKEWWDDLQVVSFYVSKTNNKHTENDERSSPYCLRNLAAATVRKSKKRKKDNPISHRVVQLYTAALKNTSLSISLLKPILDEFQSALVKDSKDEPKKPFNQSRFALIKLILIRNRKEGAFMPTYELADTLDPAYNSGVLLAVLGALQKRSLLAGREGDERKKIKKINAGVIERYYGSASSSPALVFPLLLRLSRHHLSKLQKGNDKDKGAATAIENLKAKLLAKFMPEPNASCPVFPKLLSLENQGKFALGFYQQKAYELEQYRKYKESHGKTGSDVAEFDTEENED